MRRTFNFEVRRFFVGVVGLPNLGFGHSIVEYDEM
jgi:hypothetical protein